MPEHRWKAPPNRREYERPRSLHQERLPSWPERPVAKAIRQIGVADSPGTIQPRDAELRALPAQQSCPREQEAADEGSPGTSPESQSGNRGGQVRMLQQVKQADTVWARLASRGASIIHRKSPLHIYFYCGQSRT